MSVNIVTRKTKAGVESYHVRWSRGRYDKAVHLGAWDDYKDAEVRVKRAKRILADGGIPTREALDHVGDRNIAAYAAAWLESRVNVASGTREGDRTHIEAVIRKFGRLSPRMVTWEQVQSWITEMDRGGLGDAQIKYRGAKLRAVLRNAGVSPNPVDDDRLNWPQRTWRQFIRPRNGQADIDAMRALMPERMLPMWDAFEHGGLRANEAEHLEWATTRPDSVEIVRTADFTPKTKRSYRTVKVLPHQTVNWIPERPERTNDHDHVFGITAETFRHHFTKARDAVLYPGVTPEDLPAAKRFRVHDLRHWHASTLIHERAEGKHTISDPGIAKRMGHTLAELHKTYAHDLSD